MTEVAHGVIQIDVRDEEALAAMRRLGNEVERQMDSIGREKAEAKATLDTSDIDQEVKNAKRKLRELEGRKSTLKADGRAFKKVAGEIEALNAELKKLDGKQASVHLKYKGDDERRKSLAKIAALEAKEARIREQAQQKAERIAIQSARRIEAVERKIRLDERAAYREDARIRAQSERARMTDIQKRAKVSASLRSQEAREMAQAERAAYSEEASRQRALIATQKAAEAVHNLRSEYVKTAREVEAYDQKRRAAVRTRDPLQVTQVDINHQRALAKLEQLRDRLENIGEPPPVVDLHIQPGRRLGQDLRAAFNERGVQGVAVTAGQRAGNGMLQGFRSRFNRDTFSKANMAAVAGAGLSRVFSRMGSIASGLSQATVRIGPFTATIRQALVGLAALGPMIVDIVGALGALGGVLGSATAGLGALSAGFIGGAIPSAIGFFAVLKPVTQEFGNAMKASKAYNDALQKGNTDLAAKKQKELSKILGNVDERTKQNFQNASKLSSKWTELTKPARASAFRVIGDALGFASDNVGMFADQTNKNFEVAGKSVRRWIKGMNTVEGRDILGSMMKNFRRTMGPVLDGIGNMGVYLGRVGKVASGFMPKLGRQFKDWSQSLADGAKGKEFEQKISRVVNSLKAVGRFALAGGRLMKAFFGGGVESGTRFLDTMTQAMNRWTAFLQTDAGREKLSTFFDRSITGVQSLYAALAPVIRSFTQWASALSPVVSGFFRGAGAVASFVAKIMSLTALRGPITALVATLGALWAVGKITAATVALGNFTRALLGIRSASGAVAVLSGGLGGAAARSTAMSRSMMASTAAASALAGRAGALSKSTQGLSTAQRGASASSKAMSMAMITSAAAQAKAGMAGTKAASGAMKAGKGTGFMAKAMAAGGVAARGLATAVGGTAGALLGAAAAVAYFDEKGTGDTAMGKWLTRANNFYKVGDAARSTAKALNANAQQAPQMASQYRTAKLSLAQMKQQLDGTKRGTVEHQQALMAYRDQLRFTQDAEKSWNTVKQNATKGTAQLAAAERKRAALLRAMRSEGDGKQTDEQRAKLAQYTAEVQKHKNIMATAPLNMKRAWEGLNPVLGRAQQQLGQLARTGGRKLAQKIAVKFEAPKDVGRVAAAAGRTLKAGVPKNITTKVVADSRTAEQAVRRLQRLKIKAIRFQILQRGGEAAVRMLEKIARRKLTRKEQRIAERGGPGVLRLLERIIGRKLTRKEQKIAESGGAGVKGMLDKIGGTRLPPKSVRVSAPGASGVLAVLRSISGEAGTVVKNVVTNVIRRVKKGAAGGVFAEGGITSHAAGGTGAGPDPGRIARAELQAYQRQPRDMRAGGKVVQPTMLVGEENKSEFVIATNPRYRERSIALLKMAARALGVSEDVESYKSVAQEERREGGLISAAIGARASRSRRRRRRGKKFQNTNRSANLKQVERWKDAEEGHNRMASILESRLDEPDTFLVDSGQKAPDGSPIMKVNQPVLNKYLAEMGQIRQMYAAVVFDLMQLNHFLPLAQREQQQNINSANANIALLRKDLKRQRAQAKSKNAGTRARAKKAIPRIESQIRSNETAKERATSDRDEVAAERKDAPWRLMEGHARHAEYVEDMNAIQPRVAQDLASANQQGASGSSSNLSYGQQVAASAAEQQTVLREYAANAVTARGGPTTGSGQDYSPPPAATRTMAASAGQAMATAFTGHIAGKGGKRAVSDAALASIGSSGSSAAASLSRGGGARAADAAAKRGSAGVIMQSGGGDKHITVNNEFKTGPSDPHTWSKGIEFEIGATL